MVDKSILIDELAPGHATTGYVAGHVSVLGLLYNS